MPPVSKDQQTAARIALAAKRGKIPVHKLGPAAKMMAGMSESQLSEFAGEIKKKKQ